jgi:hypothetical protein
MIAGEVSENNQLNRGGPNDAMESCSMCTRRLLTSPRQGLADTKSYPLCQQLGRCCARQTDSETMIANSK